MRRELPLILGTLAGLLVIFSRDFYLGDSLKLLDASDKWFSISAGVAVLVGFFNLLQIHIKHIQRRHEVWPYSVVLIVAMVGYSLTTLFLPLNKGFNNFVFQNAIGALSATMYGTVAFYITSAAYRAFRVRTREATVLMLAALITIIGVAPIGNSIIHGWSAWADWLLKVPVTGAYRAILIGTFLGAMATALRILLGLERAYIGSR